MPIAGILSPPFSTSEPGRAEFLSEAVLSHEGWRIERVQRFTAQVDPKQWLASVEQVVQSADMFVLLSPRNFFMFLGSYADALGDMLLDRVRNGTPTLMQVYPNDVEDVSGQPLPAVKKLFKHLELMPQDIKVAERVTLDGRQSQRICTFAKGDDCLLDPTLFHGIQDVVIAQPYLLNYDGDTFPIVAASDLQMNVDGGDFETESIPGKKRAVAVCRQTEVELHYAVSGNLLGDEYPGLFETIPGSQANDILVRRMVDKLMKWALRNGSKVQGDLEHLAFGEFLKIERGLGQLLFARLGKGFGQYCPPSIRQDLLVSDGNIDASKATLYHIVSIIEANWNSFKRGFSDGSGRQLTSSEFRTLFLKFNRDQRRYLSHPMKGMIDGRAFSIEDIEDAKRLSAMVGRARQIFNCSTIP
ncbi:MAG: hypothetical protein E5W82_05345 [Mesorhizobium sp.]|nr:MAG: hypothetical protein E5W82_05345 [Mesorhizobium sp.]